NTVNTPVVNLSAPAMTVTKVLSGNSDPDGSGTVTQGDVLTYIVTATNIGNVALTNVTVNDPLTTPNTTSCPNVPVSSTCVLTGTYTVTVANVANGTISNVGSATSTQVPGPVNSAALITPVLGGNGTLTIDSGDGQVLLGSTASAPLVVLLKNASNAPVAGATINWSATNGTLSVASSITDTSGRASNTVTAITPGPAVTVLASSVVATGPVTFNLNSSLATLPNLTPEEQAVVTVIDSACPALASQTTLTPEQADLLARCRELNVAAGINGSATADAVGELVAQGAEVQSNAAVTASVAQFQNINLRLAALRSSSNSSSLGNTSSLGGLSFAGPGGVLPLGSLMGAMLGEADTKKPEAGASFSRWGFFATGTIGRGTANERSTTPAYSYDINGLTAGVDYRQRDNWVSGVAVGFSRQTTNLAHDRGDVALTGWSLSSYSTWSFKNNLYLDGVVTWGSNQFDMNRKIDYTLPVPGGGTTSVHQIASGQPGGNLFSAALTFGGDFHKQEWNFSPYVQVVSSRMSFDSYQEKLLAGPGSGLGLSVDARTVNTLSSVLGTKVSWTHSVDWGVFIPTASLEWQHEYKSDLQAITARFTNDPTQTSFSLNGVPLDNSFFRLGLGFSVVLSRGRSGFVLFEHMLGRNGMTQDNLGLGIRIEF
ncbi:MAG: autotransporter domain-containing protein, partial [Lysobacteraceae bacterium]